MEDKILLEVKGLKKYFNMGRGHQLRAIDDISFFIKEGETVGLVGESGCGKTTCGRCIARLKDITAGQVLYEGKDVHKLKGDDRKKFHKEVQTIFQDPYSSLDPKMKVEDIISEGMVIHKLYENREERLNVVHKMLSLVGLNEEHATRYVHEFSGGQRQRIGIARALAVNPKFIICDEPISALDVSIQAQIINLLMDLQDKMRLTYLFIAHDLSVVRHISDRIIVMYLGRIMEISSSDDLYKNPLHPYTKVLISSIPIPDPKIERAREQIVLEGEASDVLDDYKGCRFKSRCKYAKDICNKDVPELKEVSPGHFVACHFKIN